MTKYAFVLLVLACISFSGCSSRQASVRHSEASTVVVSSGGAARVNDSNFASEIGSSQGIALVDFGAKWCGPCRRIEPVMDALARDLSGSVKVAKVDCDESPEISSQYRISGIPCLLLFRDGTEIARTAGFHTKEELKAWIEQYNSPAQPAAASVSAN